MATDPKAVQEDLEKQLADLKAELKDARAKLKEQAEDYLEEGSARARQLYRRARAGAHDIRERGAHAFDDASSELERRVEERPLQAVAVALGVGLLIGLVSRR
ncbi:hypothetical protein [Neomegalonema sp.]|uniref:DUF883 family protein n=1 Tax=Neomegalonema sp. TaxID=2039713 RepID=UPI00261360BB|nr:hypothetical protein [Neomegalonema sp.]MDD2869223.1 hypothetical protein [Neomegalonema sp.]